MSKQTSNMDLGLGSLFRGATVFQKGNPPLPKATPMPKIDSAGSSGDFFIRMALDLLVVSKDYRRNEVLKTAITAAFGK
jgi:hypothetical protein